MFSIQKLAATFQKAFRKVGWFGFLRVCLYPVTTPFTTSFRLLQMLWSCRRLADGKWGDYPHFSFHMAITSLFYWTRALNIYRFGRSGRSPYLGLGNYRLSRAFHYALPSLYAYWIAGAPTILIGLIGWWLSHLVWVNSANVIILSGVMGLALISTLFYSNLARQNYNVLGWMFFPIGLYGLITGQWVLAGGAWLAASFGSFTVVVLGGMISLVFGILNWSPYTIIAVIPAALKLGAHFWPSFVHHDFDWVITGVSKAIGLVDGKAKYRRAQTKKINLRQMYLLLTYIQFLLAAYLFGGKIAIYFLAGVLVFLVNLMMFRFADEQSMHMLIFSLATALTIEISKPLLLVFYWILVSPLPHFLAFPSSKNVYDIVPPTPLFNIQPFMNGMKDFLSPVKDGQRVLMAFDNPAGVYEHIFDGQRVLLELPCYVSTMRGIHYLPDWWAVFEVNYEGAPDFWGRDVSSALHNVQQWKADYLVIYQEESGTDLDPKWTDAGFRPVGKFAWPDYMKGLQDSYSGPLPDWWLLEIPGY